MKLIIVLAALTIITFVGNSYAAKVWLEGQVKDDEGKTVCVYKSGFDKIYMPADVGDYCPLTIDK